MSGQLVWVLTRVAEMLGDVLGSSPDAKPQCRTGVSADMDLEVQELRLSIDPGSDPITGRIGPPDGSQKLFEGYVQLVAALEQFREVEDAHQPPRRESA
jgi:hypothetical protein